MREGISSCHRSSVDDANRENPRNTRKDIVGYILGIIPTRLTVEHEVLSDRPL